MRRSSGWVAGLEEAQQGAQRRNEKRVVRSTKWVKRHRWGTDPGGSKVARSESCPGHDALGYTLQLPQEERFLNSKQTLKVRSPPCLGGRSAEEIVFARLKSPPAPQRPASGPTRQSPTEWWAHLTGNEATRLPPGLRQTGWAIAFLAGGSNPRRSVSEFCQRRQRSQEVRRSLVGPAHGGPLEILHDQPLPAR